ncbi:LPS biosynthesis related glycosyltransferase [Brachyspira hampsonii 30446]|uniref:LPS biosynthesis related glycosyltransferase n=2 Tax=Brachyspira hampsonii TaxID=1287055 RepID=A0A2U4ETY0_9SPIR|nr:LPS biosynthesis glycosyltransferase [Brachyspira hampsonii]EKV55915.1 LPS biosynthesis related glycosyltransferase [Brachyspira hampsonii 30446]MBW5395105.1 LPS biosynthesis glycosyltransferase [Brachyspira hampsonii]OEJ17494.1 glycosyltransferase [Brachyspira hampsonii]
MSYKLLLKKNLIEYLVWPIPIRSIRNKIRMDSIYLKDLGYKINYNHYKNNIKNKKTFFVRNDWSVNEKEFSQNIFYNLIKKYYISDLEIGYNPDIEYFGPVGKRYFLENSKAKIKIFYTGECVSKNAIDKTWAQYSDNCIDYVDLSLSFERLDENKYQNYVRFPIWIFYNFYGLLDNKDYTKDDIKKVIDNINSAKSKKNKFASLVASHDATNIRTQMYDKISKIDNISCPGKLFHNDDTLKQDFNNDKIEYLRDFKFNICPENTISDGYITEKLFDAFKSGCIPIYNGDENIELDLVNKNALLFFKKDEDNTELIKEIEKLHKDDKLFDSFQKQIKIYDSMVDYLWERRTKILNRLETLINEKLK